MQTLDTGDTAPQFNLLDQQGNETSLSQCLTNGPVLVYFYPKALTPGCTTQACGLRDSSKELAELNVTVLGISPDPVIKLSKFADKYQLNFSLLSDENHQIADAFGVWGEKKFMGKIYDGIHRISFLIGQDGKIIHTFKNFKTKEHQQMVIDYMKHKSL